MDAEIASITTRRSAVDSAVTLLARIRLLTVERLGERFELEGVSEAKGRLEEMLPELGDLAVGVEEHDQLFAAAADGELGDAGDAVRAALQELAEICSQLEAVEE